MLLRPKLYSDSARNCALPGTMLIFLVVSRKNATMMMTESTASSMGLVDPAEDRRQIESFRRRRHEFVACG